MSDKTRPFNSSLPICPVCGTTFFCGTTSGESRCWCFDLPNIMPVDAAQGCLCPACLKASIEATLTVQDDYYQDDHHHDDTT